MTQAILPKVRATGLMVAASCAILLASCQMFKGDKDCCEDCECRQHAKVCSDPTMHALASDLDYLEAQIDKYGSVVAMQPSVWGQARLTKYRDEYEKEMIKDFPKFNETLQGSVSRSDQAYLANAMAIAGAISAPAAVPTPALLFNYPNPNLQISLNQASAPSSSSSPAPTPDASVQTDVFNGFSSMSRSPVRGPLNLGFAGMANGGISLEPTIVLSQKARYLEHLNQIRRNNEGDDTADAPGYSLNLVRIPVSVLPGKCTLKGYGAEITITLKTKLSDELLPTTFQQLVLNDLEDQLSLPLTNVIEVLTQDELDNFGYKVTRKTEDRDLLRKQIAIGMQENEIEVFAKLNNANNDQIAIYRKLIRGFKKKIDCEKVEADKSKLVEERKTKENQMKNDQLNKIVSEQKDQIEKTWNALYLANPHAAIEQYRTVGKTDLYKKRAKDMYDDDDDTDSKALDQLFTAISQSQQRVSPLPIPPSQVTEAFGPYSLCLVASDIYPLVDKHRVGNRPAKENAHKGAPYYSDVKAALRDELGAAYKMLSHEENTDLWVHCSSELVTAIRSRDDEGVANLRSAFLGHLKIKHTDDDSTTTDALAWAIIVESALLDARLKQDMVVAASNKGLAPPQVDSTAFYLPSRVLSAEARHAFNEYVQMRWPIHVFAIDPMSQDQNLADADGRRQEMQLALSLSFASGNLSANNMTRYARRIEEDMETIGINRTQVGFSHGNDTFGWRFYPRFQTPEFVSNAESIFRDQLIGGPSKNSEIDQMRLEPGMRECVAIVMMPSFVPFVTAEVSSNWFKLTNPKHKEFTLTDAVRLGAIYKSVENCKDNVQNAQCYRDCDKERLIAKAKQLEKRLPLQDMLVQVPYENTLGGFEMFNTGVTDLAPQLRGWYGGPGVSTKTDTQLFLVGNHFSIHHTKVVAGGKDVEFELISRQVMKVTIPKGTVANEREEDLEAKCDSEKKAKAETEKKGAPPIPSLQPCLTCGGQKDGTARGVDGKAETKSKKYKYVDVHVATPYGVTSHLEIPQLEVAESSSQVTHKNTGLTWVPDSAELAFRYAAGCITPAAPPHTRPPVTIKWDMKKLGPPLDNAVTYDLKMSFAKPFGEAKVTYPHPFDEKAAVVVSGIPAANITDPVTTALTPSTADLQTKFLHVPNNLLTMAIVSKFSNYFGPKNVNPPVPVRLNKAILVAKDAAGNVLGQTELGNELTITWQDIEVCYPALPTPPLPCGALQPPPVWVPPQPHPIPGSHQEPPIAPQPGNENSKKLPPGGTIVDPQTKAGFRGDSTSPSVDLTDFDALFGRCSATNCMHAGSANCGRRIG